MPSPSADHRRSRHPSLAALRPPEPSDGPELWALAARSGLDRNSPYAYAMWGEYFPDTSIVAVERGRLVGFVIGFRPEREPAALFVWQIAVDDDRRGAGLAGRMLDALVRRSGTRVIEATFTPSNAASAALFRGLGARRGAVISENLLFGDDILLDGHEPEIRIRVALDGTTHVRN